MDNLKPDPKNQMQRARINRHLNAYARLTIPPIFYFPRKPEV